MSQYVSNPGTPKVRIETYAKRRRMNAAPLRWKEPARASARPLPEVCYSDFFVVDAQASLVRAS